MLFVIPVMFLVIVAAIIFGVIRQRKAEQARIAALAAFAGSRGMTFSVDDPLNLPGLLSGMSPFNIGHDRAAGNVLQGDCGGRRLILFDFKYVTTETHTDAKGNTTTSEESHYLSACLHPLEFPFPSLVIRHEGFFDKVGEFFGSDAIKFESDEFSRRFHVKSSDRKFAYAVCNPQMMEWLLANQGWHMEFTDGWWLLITGSRWKPEQFQAASDVTLKFFDLIPEFVWKEYRERAGNGG
jgi:hypothetical protein